MFNGKSCRYYVAGRVWVSRDASVIGYTTRGHDQYGQSIIQFHPLRIQQDGTCSYVSHPSYGFVSVPKSVATCFCPPPPCDGKKYVINFKDGNCRNCCASNLEWGEYHYKQSIAPSTKVGYEGNVLTVYRDGTVKNNGTVLSISENGHFDDDMGLYFPGSAMAVRPRMKPILVDELMRLAGFVNGDDAVLHDPVILHRDLDWANIDSDNLEWVDRTDPRYSAYQEKIREARQAISDSFNSGKPVPDYWVS